MKYSLITSILGKAGAVRAQDFEKPLSQKFSGELYGNQSFLLSTVPYQILQAFKNFLRSQISIVRICSSPELSSMENDRRNIY